MRYRGQEPVLRRGALRPTIAAAMIYVADPQQDELIVDPMCGTGTVLQEGLLRNRRAQYAGGDIDDEAVALAKEGLGLRDVRIEQWDATDLPFDSNTIDCIVCNLPFGKQYSAIDDNRSLYEALLSNWTDKLRPEGRMVLLTSDTEALEGTLSHLDLRWKVVCKVKVLGVWAKIYRIWRRCTQAAEELAPE